MAATINKSNADREFFNRRLDEIRMNGHERLKAKAHLARAEAMAAMLAAAVSGIRQLFSPSDRGGHAGGNAAPSAG